MIKICVWTLTSRSYFGKMNSTLGSVVPLAMFSFVIDTMPLENRILGLHSSSNEYMNRVYKSEVSKRVPLLACFLYCWVELKSAQARKRSDPPPKTRKKCPTPSGQASVYTPHPLTPKNGQCPYERFTFKKRGFPNPYGGDTLPTFNAKTLKNCWNIFIVLLTF